jgi:ABC-type transport system involved in multi-copper enzyme maturation permease subunit
MVKLLKSEMKKISLNKLAGIFFACIIVILFIEGCILFGLGTDGKIGVVLQRTNENLVRGIDKWSGWTLVAFQFSIIFNKAAYLIVEGVLIAQIFIDEFKNKTIFQLFSYPIKKGKILWSKIILILVITLILSILSQVVIIVLIKLIAISTGYSFNVTSNQLFEMIRSIVGISFLGLTPIAIGSIKNSPVSTIISSVIIVVAICNAFPGTAISNFINSMPITIIMISFGTLICHLSIIRKANNSI